MSGQIFSDGIGSIAIVGGVARIDLVVLSPTERETSGQPKAVFQQQIVMGVEAFLRSTEKMHGAAQALAKLASQQAAQATTEPRPPATVQPAPVIEPATKHPFP